MKQETAAVFALLISVTLLSPIILSLSSATTVTIGQTASGNYSAWQSGGIMVGSKFIASAGTPLSISVYISQSGSSSNTGKCAIYSESGKQLLAVTEEKTYAPGFNGWLTFNFGFAPSLTAGSSYSLVVWFKDSHSSLRYSTGSAAQTWYAFQPYTGNFPSGPYTSLSNYGQENNVYSIYCTLTSVQTTQTTPSPSPSPTPSQTTSPTPSTFGTTFGQTTKGSYSAWQPDSTILASRFTASTTGKLSSVTVYLTNGASTSNNIKCAVYSETNKALLASSQELTIGGKASGWFTVATSSSPSIVANQKYSLVVWFKNSGIYIPYNFGSSSQSWYKQQSYGSFATTYSLNGQENTVYSLYATINSETTSPTLSPLSTVAPTPTPIPIATPKPVSTPTSPNLAPILGSWGDYNIFGDVCYGNPKIFPQITHADFSVTRNGNPSVRIDGPGIYPNGAREVNHGWISVKPGDHIVFKCWIKTNPSAFGDGGTIAFDAYGPNERIMEVHPRTIQTEIWNGGSRPTGWSGMSGSPIYVPYGRDWTQITLEVTIPSTTFTYNDWQKPLTYGPQQIAGILPMLAASWNKGESASVWFTDAELYINP